MTQPEILTRERHRLLAHFTTAEIDDLQAAFDCVIPADTWPGGWDGGVCQLLSEHGSDFLADALETLRHALQLLNSTAQSMFGEPFVRLGSGERDKVFGAAASSDPLADGGVLHRLVSIGFEGFYGGTREPAGWAMVGFAPVPPGVKPQDPEPILGLPLAEVRAHYDVVVVGAGAGGGVVAATLAAAGLDVLVLERARRHRDIELRGNHLQGKRLGIYDVTAGPGHDNPRMLELPDGSIRLLPGEGDAEDYGLNAMTAGGGTRLWQGMAWRFFPEDFAMASTYGTPPESTLQDWPFGYDELEPYYDRVEWALGVAGDASSDMARRTRRRRDYPMPPLPGDAARDAYSESAARLGIHASPIPFAINSVPSAGRPACVRCSQCLGHTCPVNAKNGSHNTFLTAAVATGRCFLLFSAQATRILHDGTGTARGLTVMVETNDGPIERTVLADRVVICAGAIETPRLLLESGLGNDWVGRNLHSHAFASALSFEAPAVKSWIGPGHSVASVDWVHRNGEAWGGGVMFDMPPLYPLAKAVLGQTFAPAPFGRRHKQWMRDSPHALGAMAMVQEIPHALSRVRLDPTVTDRYGMSAVRTRGVAHPASQVAADYMAGHCADWIAGVGAKNVHRTASPGGGHGGEHAAGTALLGDDPNSSACDPAGLLHGTSNVFVADASVHPTNGGFNPTLTVMANAMRIASLMIATG